MYLQLLLCMSHVTIRKTYPYKDEAMALVAQKLDKATCIQPKSRYTADKC